MTVAGLLVPRTAAHTDGLLLLLRDPIVQAGLWPDTLEASEQDWFAEGAEVDQVVIDGAGRVAGAVQVRDGELAVFVGEAWRRQGVASEAMAAVAQCWRQESRGALSARCALANAGSQAALLCAGFRFRGRHATARGVHLHFAFG